MVESRDARRQLAFAIKARLATMPLAKITVAQLCRDVGITRQAFYYHFVSVEDLAVWLFRTEVADHIVAHASLAEWADGFERLLVYLKSQREQTYAVVTSLDLKDLEQFFFRAFRSVMTAIVAELGDGLTLRDVDRELVIDHFALSVLGHFLHWIATDMRADPVRLTSDLQFILDGRVAQALERLALPQR